MHHDEVGLTGAAMPPRRWFHDPVLTGLTVAAVLVAGELALGVADSVGALRLFWCIQPLTDAVIAVAAFGIARIAKIPSHRRLFRAITFAGVMLTLGDTTQTVNVIRAGADASAQPGLIQSVAFVIAVGTVLVTLMFHPTAVATARQRYRFALDTATVLIGGAGLVWAVSVQSSSDVAAALIVAGLVMAVSFAGLKLLRTTAAPFTGAATLICVLATSMQGVGIVIAGQAAQPPGLLLAFQVLPSFLMPAGIRVQRIALDRERAVAAGHTAARGHDRVRSNRSLTILPYVAMVAANCALVVVLAAQADVRIWGVVVAVVSISALVSLRQIDHLIESSRRTDDLEGWERWVNALLRHSADVTTVIDRSGQVTYASPSLQAVLGFLPTDLIGRPGDELVHPEDLADYATAFNEVRAVPGATAKASVRSRHSDGDWRWLEITMTNLLTDPLVRGIVGNARDVTNARGLQDRLRHEATHDPLTGLPNRTLFAERLDDAIGEPLALLLIDLDGFKAINDTYGHPAGDEILVAVASRLRRCVRPEDTPARLGGDEFAVVLPGADLDDAERVAARLTVLLTDAVAVDGVLLTVQASIGIATGPTDDREQLMRNADEAMYASKRSQNNLADTVRR